MKTAAMLRAASGRQSGFNPLSIAGAKVWLNADSLGTGLANNDPVSSWTNLATVNPFTAAGGARPLYKTNILNGHSVIRFDGSDDILSAGDLSALFPTAATLFVVATPTDTQYNLYQTSVAADGWWDLDGAAYFATFRAGRVVNNPAVGMPGTGTHRWTITSIAGANGYKVRLDAVEILNVAGDYAGGAEHQLGRTSNPFLGDIAEVIAYDTVLSGANITVVEGYLATKYAL